jgi:Zn-finger nucleic acid-binding protein
MTAQVTRPRCLRCSLVLSPLGPDGVLSCAGCGGEFCERSALEAIVERARLGPAASRYVRPVLHLTDPIRYVACPVCSELMVRRNYGASSGVVVDVCGRHGVWFDHGELAQVLAFCANGGLDRLGVNNGGVNNINVNGAQWPPAHLYPDATRPHAETVQTTVVTEVIGVCIEVVATLILE